MARLDFICDNEACGHIVQDVITKNGEPLAPLKHCGKPMVVQWMTLPQSAQVFEAFTTRNIHPDGKPLKVRNKGDLQRYYQQYGVVHVDDPSLVAEGSEIRRKGAKIGKVFDFGKR